MRRLPERKKFVFFLFLITACGFIWLRFENKIRNFFSAEKKQPSVRAPAEKKRIMCYISGGVRHRGVYRLPEGSTVKDLVNAAGGLIAAADSRGIDFSAVLEDSHAVKIPKKNLFGRIGLGRAPRKTYFMPPMKITEEK